MLGIWFFYWIPRKYCRDVLLSFSPAPAALTFSGYTHIFLGRHLAGTPLSSKVQTLWKIVKSPSFHGYMLLSDLLLLAMTCEEKLLGSSFLTVRLVTQTLLVSWVTISPLWIVGVRWMRTADGKIHGHLYPKHWVFPSIIMGILGLYLYPETLPLSLVFALFGAVALESPRWYGRRAGNK